MIDSATTPSATGRPGSHRSPHHNIASAATPIASVARFVPPIWPARMIKPVGDVVASTGDTEQCRQLRNRYRQAGTGLEPGQNAVTDQLDQHAEPECPGDQAE